MTWKGKKPTEFILEIQDKSEKHIQKIARDTIKQLVINSPVDTGSYRYSHIASNNMPDYSIRKGKGDAIAAAEPNIAAFKLGGILFIQNNLPYAEVIEFGGYPKPPQKGSWNKKSKKYEIKSSGGYSMQAPKGVYSVTFNYIVNKYGG